MIAFVYRADWPGISITVERMGATRKGSLSDSHIPDKGR